MLIGENKMLKLKSKEICIYSTTCPYNNSTNTQAFCKGADPSRVSEFTCNFVDNGVFVENKFRSGLDETGTMKVISE
jgi:hypothetical protein